MEFWNARNMLAPPTITYEGNVDDIDINHLKTIFQDGMNFYSQQNILNLEIGLLSRIIYRMKTKFKNSKDFHSFEKVKRVLCIFEEMDIPKKIEYFLSILPGYDYHKVTVSLPTKNMMDYILVQLQGVGKILCKAIETCKLTAIIYEHRLYLGHFWQLALIAISIVARVHILCLNMVKYTYVLYSKLLPFSHKLKNIGKNWLPKDYVFPKDLKSWLNIEWSKLEEVVEVPDDEFVMTFIDLADSDDEVEFIEVSEILEDFKKIQKSGKGKKAQDQPLIISPSLSPKEIESDEDVSDENNEKIVENITSTGIEETHSDNVTVNVGGEITPDDHITSSAFKQRKMEDIDIGEVIITDGENTEYEPPNQTPCVKTRKTKRKSSHAVVISSSEDEDCVQFVDASVEKPFSTTDFIPIEASTPSIKLNKKRKKTKKCSSLNNSEIRKPLKKKKKKN